MSASTIDVASPASVPVAEAPGFGRRLVREPVAFACIAYLIVVVLVAIVAPLIWPGVASENAGDLAAVNQGPSGEHLLGTDALGRDVLQRLLVGTRVTMLGALEAVVVVLLLGVPTGLAAGYFGGALDKAVGWLAELTFALPTIIVIIVVLSVFPQSMLAGMCTLGVIVAPALMRVVRAAALPVRQELSIDAARVAGLSDMYIITRHVLPRVSGVVIVQASLLAAIALLVQTGLSFLGLIVAAPAPSWGGMVADGINVLDSNAWLIWPPGIAIAVTILAFGLLGDAVRDANAETWSGPIRRGGAARRRPSVPSASATATASAHDAETGRVDRRDDALLSVEGLDVRLASPAGQVSVLQDVSFDIRSGETVGVVGESGCGKTMTAMAVLGLLPEAGEVTAGRILFDGRDLVALTESQRRRVRGKEIAFVSQDPMISLDPAFRVGRQLAEAVRRHHGVSRAAARARVLELLRKVHLPDPELVAQRYPHELSGGMAQRVSLARALSGEPRLLIADEPTTALDVTVQAEVLELLRELQHERNMAMLLVTHDWSVVADMCDRAVVMYAGQVVERADLVPLFREPLHPYTEALLAANPHATAHGTEMLPTIPGSVPQLGTWPSGCHFHPRCRYATSECTSGPIPLSHAAGQRDTRCIHHDQLARP